jgi:hypothetical protein
MNYQVVYWIGVRIVGVVTFISIWIYAFFSWGFLIGLGIGWLPAIIGAAMIGFLWPITVGLPVLAIMGFVSLHYIFGLV